MKILKFKKKDYNNKLKNLENENIKISFKNNKYVKSFISIQRESINKIIFLYQ